MLGASMITQKPDDMMQEKNIVSFRNSQASEHQDPNSTNKLTSS